MPRRAFLEGFHEITYLVPKTEQTKEPKSFKVVSDKESLRLSLIQKTEMDADIKYTLHFKGFIFLNEIYHVIDDQNHKTELYSGEIVRTKLFDELYYYDGDDLGFTYHKNATTFKVWTPVAKEISVILLKEDGEEKHPMRYKNQGVWQIRIEGDLEGQAYLLEAYLNGERKRFNDPYAISSRSNGKANYIIDKTRLKPQKHPRPFTSHHPTNAIIYEVSVRDFSMGLDLKEERGTFNAFVKEGLKSENNAPIGFDYLKDLGVTHVQLLPIFDFEGVDESDRFKQYNWGYNPSQFNVPEGSFTNQPDDPYARINELRSMVDTIHKHGMNVIMDVVYNHVYNTKSFSLGLMVPGYYYRVDHNGVLTNASGCDSDFASERKMARKMIVDSILHWVEFYQVDGFRFDLMGLIDIHTMHVLRQKLESISPNILLYGEGWQMGGNTTDASLCHMQNDDVLFNIGFFNDKVRDLIKGETFRLKSQGYAHGAKATPTLKNLIRGLNPNQKAMKYPSQTINYVECHDNHTFYDKTKHATEAYETTRIKMQKLATSMMLLMQGVPFIHGGQEFYRSKQDHGNSYKSSDAINKIDWQKKDEHLDDIEAFKALIKIRKSERLLRLKTTYDIEEHTHVRNKESGTIIYELANEDTHLIIFFKNNQKEETFTFDTPFDIIYQSENQMENDIKRITLDEISTTILKLKKTR